MKFGTNYQIYTVGSNYGSRSITVKGKLISINNTPCNKKFNLGKKLQRFIIGSISGSILIHVKNNVIIMCSISSNLLCEVWAKLLAFYCRQHSRQQVICCPRHSNYHQQHTLLPENINLSKNISFLSLAAYPAAS